MYATRSNKLGAGFYTAPSFAEDPVAWLGDRMSPKSMLIAAAVSVVGYYVASSKFKMKKVPAALVGGTVGTAVGIAIPYYAYRSGQ